MLLARFIKKRLDPLRIRRRAISERLGNPEVAWTFCPRDIDEKSVVYCFGVGRDLSFECALIEKYRVRVHAFDFTPRSVEWVKSKTFSPLLSFHEMGIGAKDGTVTLYPPENPDHVSYSIVPRGVSPESGISLDVLRLSTIMKRLGHSRVDLLKMDIEGSEFEVIDDILESALDVRQLLVEFHHRFEGIGELRLKRTLKRLRQHGYRIFAVSDNREELSFLRD